MSDDGRGQGGVNPGRRPAGGTDAVAWATAPTGVNPVPEVDYSKTSAPQCRHNKIDGQ